MTPTLSPRLQAVADLAIPDEPAADIGCDHAQLAAWWVESGMLPHAVASDVSAGPLTQARKNLAAAGVLTVDVRHGSGLSTLRPGEVATIAIAGMGGHLMVKLLHAHPEVVSATRRIILQPNTGWEHVRGWLAARRTTLEAELLTDDADHTYLTMAFAPGARGGRWDEADIVLGPLLRRERPPVFTTWVRARYAHLEGLSRRLSNELGAKHPRVREVTEELRRLDEAITQGCPPAG